MNRPVFYSVIALLATTLCGQEKIVGTRVYTNPPGTRVWVDEQEYSSAGSFMWPAGSKHTLRVQPVQDGATPGTRYVFKSWADSSGQMDFPSPTLGFTADPAISWVRVDFELFYLLDLQFFECGSSDLECRPPGSVYIEKALYTRSAQIWVPAKKAVSIQASPNPGFVFSGWNFGTGLPTAQATTITMDRPMNLQPRFEPAKKVTLLTSPPELAVLADRERVNTPVTLDWGMGSKHVLGAPEWQDDKQGALWVFDSWAHGGGQNTAYTVSATNVPETLTARFVPGARVAFLTSPAGLKLTIDGRQNWQAYTFVWGVGTKHQIAAPAEQTDARGRRHVFRGWSNGGPAAQDLTVPSDGDVTGVRLTASYEMMGKLSVQSSPAGMAIQVDGAECRTPCVLDRPSGVQARLSAPAYTPLNDATRLDFASWSDGGSPERVWTFTSDAQSLTVNYRTMHRLISLAEPEEGAVIRCEPASVDSFYASGTVVSVSAEVRPGFRFRGWDGDLNGPFRTAALALTAPRTVRARLDRVPYLSPTAVRNAAADTPEPGVAPGSIVSIFGASLAAAYELGPASPLAQTIGNVTVRTGDRVLPLVFVSPEQINAQIPSDLPEGEHTLVVRWEGRPEASAVFTVVRNAPGLFERVQDTRRLAAATHQDGTPVGFDSPVKAGELVTLYGTGFGPLSPAPPDGFAVPDVPAFPLADPLEIVAGDVVLQPAASGAAPGYVGTAFTRFLVSDALPSGAAVELKVRVNGRESNPVLLPIE